MDVYESISAAMEKHESVQESVQPEAAPEPVVASESTPTAPEITAEDVKAAMPSRGDGRDEKGRFAAKEAKDAAEPVVEAPTLEPTAKDIAAKPEPVAVATPEAIKPPQSWKPAARESWGKLPPEAQQEVVRRERETAVALQEAAESRKGYQAFKDTVAPFEHMIRAEGGEPLRAVASLLQTAAALRTAPPAHKAQLVAKMIKDFGVPIDVLDSALAGQPVSSQQPTEIRDPRLDKFLAEMQQSEERRVLATQQKHQKEIEQFKSNHEFFEDVRDDVALILERDAQRGLGTDLEAAYNKAIRLNPDVSRIVEQREAAKAAANAQASTQRTKAASSSIKSQPAAAVGAAQPRGIEEAIRAAMAKHAGR